MEILYKPCDHHAGHKLAGTDDEIEAMAKAMADMMQDIWKKKGMPKTINKEVTKSFATKLFGGTEKGYGQSIGKLDYNTPDYKMLSDLQENVYAFSSAKNWQQMKAMTEALVGENDKLKTFDEFKQAAIDINNEHLQYLKTEYNTAISGGQMASKWVDIERDKEDLPLLQFDAVMDDRTTELCASFDGTILPVDDPFWDANYPPNHFNCRSTVRQLSSGKITDKKDIVYPDNLPKMFQTNLAKSGLVFPKNSTYFIGVPDKVLKDGKALIPKPDARK